MQLHEPRTASPESQSPSSARPVVFPRLRRRHHGFPSALAPVLATAISGLAAAGTAAAQTTDGPRIQSILTRGAEVVISTQIPAGYRHAALEGTASVESAFSESLVAAPTSGAPGTATFRIPNAGASRFLRVRLGTETTVPPATYPAEGHFSIEYSGTSGPLTAGERASHVLSRLTYGPTPEDLMAVQSTGVAAFIESQLNPDAIDESTNTELATREAALFSTYQPREDTRWIAPGDTWRYFKGNQAPPAGWKDPGFDDGAWPQGASGLGYGDDDDITGFPDMRQSELYPGYLTIFVRKTFDVTTPDDFDAVLLEIDYDDGFVAYLNGTEIARANVTGTNPAYNQAASTDHEAGVPEEFDLSSRRNLLKPGANVLAIQLHNVGVTSSDASLIPAFIGRKILPIPAQKRIRDLEALQQLIHVRGALARRQLEAVLAEFWENHF
ncbi:MAG: DUF1800 family protein, partial [Limisphaerales bacterium]